MDVCSSFWKMHSYSMVVHHYGDGVFHFFLMLKDQSSRFSHIVSMWHFSLQFPASLRGFMGLTGRSEETSDAWNRQIFGEQDDDFGVLNWWFHEATKFWPAKNGKVNGVVPKLSSKLVLSHGISWMALVTPGSSQTRHFPSEQWLLTSLLVNDAMVLKSWDPQVTTGFNTKSCSSMTWMRKWGTPMT